MTIGDRLLKLRREKKLSQEDIANELDVSRQTISKWETNQSTPDFDKIVPLCKLFGITTDELLTGSTNIIEAKAEVVKTNFARNIAIAVMLYIISLVALILCAAQLDQPIIGVSLFFTFIAVATGLIVYNAIYYKKESKKESKEELTSQENSIVKQINSIIDIIGLIIYFVVSFTTFAWHITWIIFIIIGAINKIVKLLFYLKENNNTKEEK